MHGCPAFTELDMSPHRLAIATAAPDRLRRPTGRNSATHGREIGSEAKEAKHIGAGEPLVVVGASTGGTEALKVLIAMLPASMPGIVMVQHMPEMYTPSFAQRLDTAGALRVSEACHNETVRPGRAYLAPGHSHVSIQRNGSGYVLQLARSEPVNRHRPSVDVLFESAASCGARSLVGVLLTGMGRDGAAGMLAMKRAGAWNIVQDEATCIVFGMPRAAIEMGAAHEVAPIDQVANRILQRLGLKGASVTSSA